MAIWNERIKKTRQDKGITLLQVANKLGVAEATAQRYESGTIKSVPYEHICRYAELLGCTPSYLMGWEDEESYKKGIEESNLIKKYNQLSEVNKKIAISLINNLLESQSSKD